MLVHRAAMEGVKNNLTLDNTIIGKDERVDFVSKFNQSSISNLQLSQYKTESLNLAIEDFKDMAVQFEYTTFTNRKVSTTSPSEIQEVVLSDLATTNLFSIAELDLISRISESFNLVEQGVIPSSSISDSILVYKNLYEILDANSENSKYLVGVILAVAEESYTWWLANPDAMLYKGSNAKIAPNSIMAVHFVAMDVSGAIIGAGIATGYQLYTGGDFDWGAVGFSTAAGAIVASTGAVGRLAGWISKAF